MNKIWASKVKRSNKKNKINSFVIWLRDKPQTFFFFQTHTKAFKALRFKFQAHVRDFILGQNVYDFCFHVQTL